MTLRNPSKKSTELPSDPFVKLAPSSLAQFAELLRLPPPKGYSALTTDGLEHQEASIAALPRELLRLPPKKDSSASQTDWLRHQKATVVALFHELRGHPKKKDRSTYPTDWPKDQKATIATFPRELQRKLTLDNFLRIPKDLELCDAHRGINEALVMWCYQMLLKECSIRVRTILRYRRKFRADCKPVVREFLDRIMGIQSLYTPGLDNYDYVPPHCRLKAPSSMCAGCVLSIVGGRPVLLVALRANMIARRRGKLPRLLALVDAWIAVLGPEAARTLESYSNTLANELLLIRVIMRECRGSKKAGESPEKKERADRQRARGEVKSSSHRGGEPAGLKRDKDDTQLPPFKLGRHPDEHASPSDVDTLFQRLEADAMVPAGLNPEVMSVVGSGTHATPELPRQEYTPSVLAQGYDGNGGFCNGYGMERRRHEQLCAPAPFVPEHFNKVAALQGNEAHEFETASVVPEPLNLRSAANNRQPTSRNTTAGTRPGTPESTSTSFVPARQAWQMTATPPPAAMDEDANVGNPFDDVSDLSDLSDGDDEDDNAEEYSSEVATEFVAHTAPSRDSALPTVVAETSSAVEILPDKPAPIPEPSATTRNTKPTCEDSTRSRRSNPHKTTRDRHHERPPMSSIASSQPLRMHTPEDYADGVAEVAEFFSMGHVKPHDDDCVPRETVETISPDDSVSAVHERATLASLRIEVWMAKAQQAEQAQQMLQQARGQESHNVRRLSTAETE